MRGCVILAIVCAAVTLTSVSADAARWCHGGPHAQGCVFRTHAACARTANRIGGVCRRQSTASRRPAARMPQRGVDAGRVYPSRPAWASPYECFYDEGYGRFRPCSAGDLP
jgi:hypothetical protein